MKSLILFVATAVLLMAGAAQAGERISGQTARIRICNPRAYSYCEQTKTYGIGYGTIVLKGSRRAPLPVAPSGDTAVEAAKMAGNLQAFIVLQTRKPENRKKAFFASEPVMVSGYVGERMGQRVFMITDLSY